MASALGKNQENKVSGDKVKKVWRSMDEMGELLPNQLLLFLGIALDYISHTPLKLDASM